MFLACFFKLIPVSPEFAEGDDDWLPTCKGKSSSCAASKATAGSKATSKPGAAPRGDVGQYVWDFDVIGCSAWG